MAIITVQYEDNKYSKDVLKLTQSDATRSSRYSGKYNITTKYGTYSRSLQIEDLVAEVQPTDDYIVVPVELAYDPFRLSYNYYGSKDLYWVILAANRLTSFLDIVEGMTVRIPDLSSIYGLDGLVTKVDYEE